MLGEGAQLQKRWCLSDREAKLLCLRRLGSVLLALATQCSPLLSVIFIVLCEKTKHASRDFFCIPRQIPVTTSQAFHKLII